MKTVKGTRLGSAIGFSVVLVALAPFFGDLREVLEERVLGSLYVTALGALFALAVSAALVTAVARIRERRRERYALLSVWVALMLAQVLFWTRPSAEVTAIERVHFVFYSLVSLLFFRALLNFGSFAGGLMALGSATVVGIADEAVQGLVPVRAADFTDILINAYAGFAGLWLAMALWPAREPGWPPARKSRRPLAGSFVLLLLSLGLYVHGFHLGHENQDDEIGTFRSLFTLAELETLKVKRARAWREHPPGPPDDLSSTEIEDYYRTEAGWRRHYVNHSFRGGEYFDAWKEYQILEKYFTPFLDLPDDYGGTFRLPREWAREIDENLDEDERRAPYVSPVGLFPRHAIWLRPRPWELWGAIGSAIGVLVFVGWRRRG